jgi:hypothetical protein
MICRRHALSLYDISGEPTELQWLWVPGGLKVYRNHLSFGLLFQFNMSISLASHLLSAGIAGAIPYPSSSVVRLISVPDTHTTNTLFQYDLEQPGGTTTKIQDEIKEAGAMWASLGATISPAAGSVGHVIEITACWAEDSFDPSGPAEILAYPGSRRMLLGGGQELGPDGCQLPADFEAGLFSRFIKPRFRGDDGIPGPVLYIWITHVAIGTPPTGTNLLDITLRGEVETMGARRRL